MREDKRKFAQVFGRNLRVIRKIENDLTLEGLAEKINMDDKHLGSLERGDSIPSVYTLYKMSVRMKMNIDQLFHNVQKELEDNQNDETN